MCVHGVNFQVTGVCTQKVKYRYVWKNIKKKNANKGEGTTKMCTLPVYVITSVSRNDDDDEDTWPENVGVIQQVQQ